MPRSAHKTSPKTPDEVLADHLEHAESHLIDAVNLFGKAQVPKRETGYLTKLARAQEMVTGLYREELVRARGPVHSARPKRKGKR